MPTGLLIIGVITLPLALASIIFGMRLARRTEPLKRGIFRPSAGLIADPAEKLAATRRIGRA
jgi:hypothetical protein